jgi:hypothetical protein
MVRALVAGVCVAAAAAIAALLTGDFSDTHARIVGEPRVQLLHGDRRGRRLATP